MRARSNSAPERRASPDDTYTGLDNDALIAALRADCPRAAIKYIRNTMADCPDSVASCTLYRAGTLVVARPDTVQALPCRIDAAAGLDAKEVVVSRRAVIDRTSADHYDLVHVVSQPALRVLFAHIAVASDALVRSAAVTVVNEDAQKNVSVPKCSVVKAEPGLPVPTTTGDFKAVVLNENEDGAVSTRSTCPPLREKRDTHTRGTVRSSERCSDGSDDCEADDLEVGNAKETAAYASETTAIARRCAIL